MKSRTTLTVVVMNYNQKEFLEKMILSVLAQSRQPDQFIVIDDCSTDGSIDVISKYRSHPSVQVIQNQENLGVVSTMKKAEDIAISECIFHVGADDVILPGFFEQSMSMLEKYPEAPFCCSHPAFVYAETNRVDTHDTWHKHSPTAIFLSPEEATLALSKNKIWLASHTAIVRRVKLKESGGYNPNLKWHCDWFVFHVMALRFGFCYIPEALSALRVFKESSTYASARHSPLMQSEVLFELVKLLQTPAFADIKLKFENSQVLDCFDDYAEEVLSELSPWKAWPMRVARKQEIKMLQSSRLFEEISSLKQEITQLKASLEQQQRSLIAATIGLNQVKDNLRAYNILKKAFKFLRPIYLSIVHLNSRLKSIE